MDQAARDSQTVKLVRTCWAEGTQDKENQIRFRCPVSYRDGSPLTFSEPWPEFRAMVRGDQWRWFPGMPANMPRPVKNILRTNVLSYATRTGASRPRIGIFPREQNDVRKADVYDAVLDKLQHDIHWDLVTAAVLFEAGVCGLSYYKVTNDDSGPGDFPVVVERVRPDNVVIEPGCTAVEYMLREPTWMIERYRAQVGRMKEAYPKADWPHFNPKADEVEQNFTTAQPVTLNPAEECWVYEMSLKDPSRITWEQAVGDAAFLVDGEEYPHGRCILVSGGIVLNRDDQRNPNSHGQMPLTPVFMPMDPDRFYPTGLVEQLLPTQLMRNYQELLIFEGTRRSVGNVTVINSALMNSEVSNEPNAVFDTNDIHNAVKFDRPPGIPRHYYDNLHVYDEDAKDIAMSQDMAQGRFVPGNKTATEVNALIEANETYIQLCARHLTWAIRRVGYQLASILCDHNDWETFVEIAGEAPGFGMRSAKEKVKAKEYFKTDMEFDVFVEDTSTLPRSHQERIQNAQLWMQMASGPPSPLQAVMLEYIDAPKEVVDAMKNAAASPPAPTGSSPGGAGPGGPPGLPTGGPGGLPPEMMGPPMGGSLMMGPSPTAMGPGGGPPIDELLQSMMDQGLTPEDAMKALGEGGHLPPTL